MRGSTYSVPGKSRHTLANAMRAMLSKLKGRNPVTSIHGPKFYDVPAGKVVHKKGKRRRKHGPIDVPLLRRVANPRRGSKYVPHQGRQECLRRIRQANQRGKK